MRALTENETVLYDDLERGFEFVDEFDKQDYFDCLFDLNIPSDKQYKRFVVCGTVGLWDGRRSGHYEEIFDNIKDAVLKCNDGFDGYIRVFEGKYGRLYVEVAHHDGNNCLEIRELTNLGEELENNWYSVEDILNRKGATRNVKFMKRYM